MATVSFVKGVYSKYVAGKSTYDSNGTLFFCTDKPVLYANGMGIGISEETLASYFDGVKDVAYEPTTGVFTISYFKTGKANKTFTLKQLQVEGSNAIAVTGTDTRTVALKIDEANKVLSQSADGLTTTLSFYDDTTNKKIVLRGIENAEVASFNYEKFVVDGMLEKVEYNAENPNILDFTWNTAAGSKKTPIDLSKYIDTYTNGDGIALADKKFSVKLKGTGEKYLEFTQNGELATKGIDTLESGLETVTDTLTNLNASKLSASKVGSGSATNVQGILEELNVSIQSVSSEAIGVAEGNGISITGDTTKTIAAKVKANDYIKVGADGLYTDGIDAAIQTKATEIVEAALEWHEA